ncbi:MAG: FAD-binding oxidoreductase [Hoeflea sp.]|uniref:NAD(P)/FAD-dependent oxidoreductase n=1 Tax=Hoeflea sp. TaxID=1940281 RepID=UPI001D7499B1|nr:FAD-binding oxidoreductase [Hoeflea sp.]MBU4528928.1 FAD-binding oxidoreductase [Alphaproteobacteria bacterium]MBU4544061.1 FAD-binding oxidoreductase [Alphaproteobacteria bacterium]MBU4551930.1 FAD-binding oxidoreductase [Alphaproteobacteria bacterium]MBV1723395.1 FAD-binding oxidoreductase [Hoeflea sp.]MBV1760374.1 FAD-binding oxidoreductase [Hoeflea sp.]
MTYKSPIAPGVSFYEATLGDRPAYDPLKGDATADVVIVGGGFTGLQAAHHLAASGKDVVLIEGARFGDGASGRNGGQLGTGQRAWVEELEADFGKDNARAQFAVAERAKAHLTAFAAAHGIEADYRPGQISAAHKKAYVKDYRDHAKIMTEQYGYEGLQFLDRDALAAKLGSTLYHGGTYDASTGHINPLKYVVGVARAASRAGARLHENTRARAIASSGGTVMVTTDAGTITAGRALIACNAYIDGLEPVTSAHVMPIRSFIGATVPLGHDSPVIPGGESVDDSRFVVRYFRKSADGRLLFGGREAYTSDNPADISSHIRRQIVEIYPDLGDVEITHSWGGSVGITLSRRPFVREVMKNVTSIGGFSGHGVMLANYCGKLYADHVNGGSEDLEVMRNLRVGPFPGGDRLRKPLLFLALTWFSLRDRI